MLRLLQAGHPQLHGEGVSQLGAGQVKLHPGQHLSRVHAADRAGVAQSGEVLPVYGHPIQGVPGHLVRLDGLHKLGQRAFGDAGLLLSLGVFHDQQAVHVGGLTGERLFNALGLNGIHHPQDLAVVGRLGDFYPGVGKVNGGQVLFQHLACLWLGHAKLVHHACAHHLKQAKAFGEGEGGDQAGDKKGQGQRQAQ